MCFFKSRYEIFFGPSLGVDRPPRHPRGSAAVNSVLSDDRLWLMTARRYDGKFTGRATTPGTGDILLDEVACSGTETNIGACPHNAWEVHDCTHNDDVSIRCGPPVTGKTSLKKLKGKASSLDKAPLTILNSCALQPRKRQLTGP